MPAGADVPRPLPEVAELLESAHVVTIPLSTPFRGVTHREAVLLRGPLGWAEFNPFLEYPDSESARWLGGTIEAGWVGWPRPVRDSVPVNATVPAVPSAAVAEVLSRFDGCDTAKVKVAEPGQGLADDLDRVAAVRDLMGATARIRIDANCGWSLDQAVDALTALAPYQLEYAEQPCETVAELATLRRRLARAGVAVPIAADESIRKAEDPLRVRDEQAADLIVVKAPPLGGVAEAVRIITEVGLPAVVSSALDTSVGIRAGVALAAALPELDHACGLGTARLYRGDVTDDPLVAVAGRIPVRAVAVSEELLRRHAAPAERRDWWLARLRRCRQLLPFG